MFSLPSQAKLIILPVKLQDSLIHMEVDTGALLSIIGKTTYQEIFEKDHQLDSTLRLYNTYSRHNRCPSQVKARLQLCHSYLYKEQVPAYLDIIGWSIFMLIG